MNEQEKILNDFIGAFGSMRDQKIVLYGLGINTEYILKHRPVDMQVVGLMDAQNEGKVFWGYPVLSADEAGERGDVIVVVARTSVLNIIFNRIRALSDKMPVYNTSGVSLKELFEHGTDRCAIDSLWLSTPEQIYEAIDNHGTISFDIFDTLFMRRVLRPEDIFVLVEKKAGNLFDYARKRREAENLANARIEVPNIDEIYEELTHLYENQEIPAERLKHIEFETEKENLVPRDDVLRFFQYAKAKGKKVILLSDMYWPREKLQELLSALGISGYDEIIVSCEYRQTKEKGGLYGIVKEKYGSDILHIGDNGTADIHMAKENGIACQQIISSHELLLHSPLQQLLVHVRTMADRKLLGAFLSETLNSPFVLNDTKGLWRIGSERDLAKWCFAPLMTGFLSWMLGIVQGKKGDDAVILFTARDGYLFKRLYDSAIRGKDGFPTSIYFYASRRAVSVANIRGKEDIRFEAEKLHSTEKLGDILVRQFGVMPAADDTMKDTVVATPNDVDLVYRYLLRYEDEILRNAQEERNQYLAYTDSLHLSGKALYIFDLVCEGSVPRGIERLLGREGILIALGTLNIPNRYYLDEFRVQSYLGNQGEYDIGCSAFRYYKLLEMAVAPHEGSLKAFVEGRRVLETEVVSGDVFGKMQILQEEIEHAVNQFLEYRQYGEFTPALLDDFFGLVSSKYSDTTKVKNMFWHEDPSIGEKLYPAWTSIVD